MTIPGVSNTVSDPGAAVLDPAVLVASGPVGELIPVTGLFLSDLYACVTSRLCFSSFCHVCWMSFLYPTAYQKIPAYRLDILNAWTRFSTCNQHSLYKKLKVLNMELDHGNIKLAYITHLLL